MTTICRKCGGPINSISQHRFGSEQTGWEHMEGECDPYPMHTKLMAISEQSQACFDFIEWLDSEKNAALCVFSRRLDTWFPLQAKMSDLLAEHFGIDTAKLEQEKVAMVEAMRKMNA